MNVQSCRSRVTPSAGGTSISMPIGSQNRRRQCRPCGLLRAAPLEQLHSTVCLAPPCRRIAAVRRKRCQPVERRGQQSPARAIRDRTKQITGLRLNAPQMSSARLRSQSCRSFASRSLRRRDPLRPARSRAASLHQRLPRPPPTAWHPVHANCLARRSFGASDRSGVASRSQHSGSADLNGSSITGNSTAMIRWNSMRAALRTSAP